MSGVGADNARWVLPAGSAADGSVARVGPEQPGWSHTGLQVVDLDPGTAQEVDGLGIESILVPLAGGGLDVVAGEHRFHLTGRESVFAGPTDVLYLPAGTAATLTATARVRVAVCTARVPEPTPGRVPVHVDVEDVPVELRGAGTCSREVRNFGVPGVLNADRIIACEVLTPAGNWSSYPPHKHDQERPGVETDLEEIYYFESQPIAGAPADADPVGYQQVYGTAERPIDVLTQVRSGDVVLVPHGWHGPAMAAPTADLYYLNVMAGPGAERAWLICDDPAHGWVRQAWADEAVDARLPFGQNGVQQ